MPASIPVSATTEPIGLDGARPRQRRRLALTRFVRSPSGVIGGALTLLVVSVAVLADVIAPGDPLASAGPSLHPPSGAHPMGTDNFGRDILAAIVHGTRTSITVVAGVLAMSLVIGLCVGILAGYRGGLLDDALMRITDMFQSVPRFFLALLVVGLFGPGLDHLVLLLGLTSWMLLARVVRADTLSTRRREFVDAARAIGASDWRILSHHILPNVLGSAIVVASLESSRVILIEAALSFIGLGDPNSVSLGYLLNNAQSFLAVAWWMSVFPGVAIVVAVFGLNLLGDAVNEALDPTMASTKPRLRRRATARPTRPLATGGVVQERAPGRTR